MLPKECLKSHCISLKKKNNTEFNTLWQNIYSFSATDDILQTAWFASTNVTAEQSISMDSHPCGVCLSPSALAPNT